MSARSCVEARLREEVELAPLTTFGVGGPARLFVEVHGEAELEAAFDVARARGAPVTVLGGGSNVVVADRGVDGLVVRLGADGGLIDQQFIAHGQPTTSNLLHEASAALAPGAASPPAGRVLVDVFAGEVWDAFVASAVARGLAGVECLSGIPGSVGATPIQNVGAYGQEVADTIVSVRAFDTRAGHAGLASAGSSGRAFVELPANDCAFGYRTSAFKARWPGRYVVTRVRFALEPGGAPALRYAELAAHVNARGSAPTLGDVRAAVLELRGRKAMLFAPDAVDGRSAGSFFTNPTLVDAEAEAAIEHLLRSGALREGDAVPRWPAGPGRTKLSAGWLIERAGWKKGDGEGAVGLSTKHALAIVNRGGAKASDVVRFAAGVRRRVWERTGIALAPEPVLVGFSAEERAPLEGPPGAVGEAAAPLGPLGALGALGSPAASS